MKLENAGAISSLQDVSFHQKFGWKAGDFFNDPKAVSMCNAIEENDLVRMEKLIADGLDVNSVGKDGMTFLLWSFPDNQLPRFKLLLEAGADPNVLIESSLGVDSAFHSGTAVVHLAAKTRFPGYFELVMNHGGDPTLRNWLGQPVLHQIVMAGNSDTLERAKMAIEKGADINELSDGAVTPAMLAVMWHGQYDLAAEFIALGADVSIYRTDAPSRLAHIVFRQERKLKFATQGEKDSYTRLVLQLEELGEDFETVRKDCDRWTTWGRTLSLKESKARMDRETRERQGKNKKN